MNHVEPGNVANVIKAAVQEDINWNGSQPINNLQGVDALITEFWQPLCHTFPDLKRKTDIFLGGVIGEEEWVSGHGYLTGTFTKDWLGIPATGEKANIRFGQFYVMREGKIAESYAIFDLLAVMRQAGFQVLPPARGGDGGKVPGPITRDGILFTEQDALETQKTRQLVSAMFMGTRNYDWRRGGCNLHSMESEHYWHPNMHWYGPSGIGACLSLKEHEDFHQRPWLHSFGDRGLYTTGGRQLGMSEGEILAEGHYSAIGIWDAPYSVHWGEFLGIPATGKLMTFRDFDWYRREGNYLAQNWVPFDITDLCLQMGVDLLDRLKRQVELRKRGINWFDPPEE